MRFKVILLGISLLLSSLAFADSMSDLNHDINVLQSGRNQDQYCNQIATRKEQSRCKANVYRQSSYDIWNPIVSSAFRTMSFLYDEAGLIDELGDSKKIPRNVQNEKYNEIMARIQEESHYGLSRLDASFRQEDSIRAEARSNAAINWSLGVLGSALNASSNNAIKTNTYMINNKMITCTRNGNMTTCN